MNKPTKDKSGVKNQLFRQALCEGTIDAMELKQKKIQKTVQLFSVITTKKDVGKNGLIRETRSAGYLRINCKAEGKQIYFTMSESKAAFPECRTLYFEINVSCYTEDTGYEHVRKTSQFVTLLNSVRNCSAALVSEECQE